jgi:tRNA(Ile)-lysidine synthase
LYFRNIVRADILPYLEKYNPKIKRALSGLAEHLREDFEFISHAKKDAMEGIEEAMQDTDEVELKLKDIVTQPKAVQKEVLRDLLEKAGGEVKKLSFRHWKELEALISHKDKGSSLDLPGDIRVTRTFTALVFRRRP